MSEPFNDRLDFDESSIKLSIKPRKSGTLIYLDERSISDTAVIRSVNNEEEEQQKAYLVFDIPYEVNEQDFAELYQVDWLGFQIRYFAGWTEIACFYPHCLDSDLLKILEKQKIIRVSMKEYYYEKGRLPSYINAKGFQTVYNMISMLKQSLGSAKNVLSKKDDTINVEGNVVTDPADIIDNHEHERA